MNKRIKKKKQKLANEKLQNTGRIVSEIESHRLQGLITEYEALPEDAKALIKKIKTRSRKYNTPVVSSVEIINNNWEKEFAKMGGEVISIGAGSGITLNPFEIENNNAELTILGVNIGTFEKLSKGGFTSLKEVEELANKLRRVDRSTFEKWYITDGTKAGILKIITDLGL